MRFVCSCARLKGWGYHRYSPRVLRASVAGAMLCSLLLRIKVQVRPRTLPWNAWAPIDASRDVCCLSAAQGRTPGAPKSRLPSVLVRALCQRLERLYRLFYFQGGTTGSGLCRRESGRSLVENRHCRFILSKELRDALILLIDKKTSLFQRGLFRRMWIARTHRSSHFTETAVYVFGIYCTDTSQCDGDFM